jgi:hypothetical protein
VAFIFAVVVFAVVIGWLDARLIPWPRASVGEG